MKGSETKLLKFMEGDDKRFVIPVYQRNYDWKVENCRQLFDDLIKVNRHQTKSHFFGSIVSVYNPEVITEEYQIIDGQQRLTTVSLLLLAICNLIRSGKIQTDQENLEKMIYEKFLVDKWKNKGSDIKLQPVKSDRQAYYQLFDEMEEEHFKWSNVTINYNYFCERISQGEISLIDLYRSIQKLEIINIKLSPEDNPQLIFESLNSTGLALTEGDKIRNYILMDLSIQDQDYFYDKFWNRIEQNTDFRIDLFAREYLSIKTQRIIPFRRIYGAFKDYVQDNNLNTDVLLKDMFYYSKLFNILLAGNTSNKKLNDSIYRLNYLDITSVRAFLMEVLNLNYEKQIPDKDTADVFEMVESYIIRRQICDYSPNSLNGFFHNLNREVIRLDGTTEDYLNKLNYVLINKKDKLQFPKNSEFTEEIKTRQIYRMSPKSRIYILERLENYGTVETKNIYKHVDEGDYSIEHILPQHLSDQWKESLGADFSVIHDEWLHRLANLTLTAYNSSYSNAPFLKKRDMENGFSNSGFRLNQWISKYDQWGVDELTERADILAKRALNIWKYPESTYYPITKEFDTYSLADDPDSFTGMKIARYSLQSLEIPVKSWLEMQKSVVMQLYSEDPSIINQIAFGHKTGLKITDNPSDFVEAIPLSPDLYFEGNTSTSAKMVFLRKLLDLYKISYSDLVFYIRDSESDKERENSNLEKLYKFWESALPILQQKNNDNQMFKDSKPKKYQYIYGRIGIPRFVILVGALKDMVRVELKLDRDDLLNKQVFDSIYEHKNEIESKLGVSLIWDRGDAKKASRISHSLENIKVFNDSEFDRVTDFLGKWSSLFYSEIVRPYILESEQFSSLTKS